MKALTLYQPWATLVAIGAKRTETRSWHTDYRGPLAIHAGKNTRFIDPRKADYLLFTDPFKRVLFEFMLRGQEWRNEFFPLGAIVATCELVHCKQIDEDDWRPHQHGWQYHGRFWEANANEYAFGDYGIGRYMWFLDKVKILAEPIAAKGAQRLWDWEGRKDGAPI